MLDFHSDLDLVSFLPDPLDELAFRAAVRFCKVTGLDSSFKCNTQRPQGIGCCDG